LARYHEIISESAWRLLAEAAQLTVGEEIEVGYYYLVQGLSLADTARRRRISQKRVREIVDKIVLSR